MDGGALFDVFAPLACCAFGGAVNAVIATHVVLFVIGTGMKIFDITTDVLVIVNAQGLMKTYQAALNNPANYSDHENRTYCHNSSFWVQNGDRVTENVDLFATLISASWAVFAMAIVLQSVFIVVTIVVLVATRGEDEVALRHRLMRMLAMIQLFFTMIEDIPQNTIAIEFSWLASGRDGLKCWTCALDANCTDVAPLSLQTDQELFLSLLVSFISGIWDMATSPMTLLFTAKLVFICMGISDEDDDDDDDDDDGGGGSRRSCKSRLKIRAVIGIGGIVGAVRMHVTNFALLTYHVVPDSALSQTFRDAIFGLFIVACVITCVELVTQMLVSVLSAGKRSDSGEDPPGGACLACYSGCCSAVFTAGVMAGGIALAILAPKISWIFLIVASGLICTCVFCMICCCGCAGAVGKIDSLDDA